MHQDVCRQWGSMPQQLHHGHHVSLPPEPVRLGDRRAHLLGGGGPGPEHRAVEGRLHADIGDRVADQPVERAPARRELRPASLRADRDAAGDIGRDYRPQQAIAALVLDPDPSCRARCRARPRRPGGSRGTGSPSLRISDGWCAMLVVIEWCGAPRARSAHRVDRIDTRRPESSPAGDRARHRRTSGSRAPSCRMASGRRRPRTARSRPSKHRAPCPRAAAARA